MTSAGVENNLVFAANADFSGADNPSLSNGLQSDGDLWIGSTTPNAQGTHINRGTITSTGGSITVTYDEPNINLETTSGGGGSLVHLSTQAFSGVSSVEFTSLIDSTYDNYFILIRQIVGSSGAAFYRLRFSSNNGANYATSGYTSDAIAIGGSITSSSETSYIVMQPNVTGHGLATQRSAVYLMNVNSTGNKSVFGTGNLGTLFSFFRGNNTLGANPLNAIQFSPSTGTISGEIHLFGILT